VDRTATKLKEALPLPCRFRYALFDHDAKFGHAVIRFLKASGIEPANRENLKQVTDQLHAIAQVWRTGELELDSIDFGIARSLARVWEVLERRKKGGRSHQCAVVSTRRNGGDGMMTPENLRVRSRIWTVRG